MLESQIRDLALTRSVRFVTARHAAAPRTTCSLEAHALIDTTPREGDLPHEVLVAMASGRPVLSACDHVTRLLEVAPFDSRSRKATSERWLQRIDALATAWSDELLAVGQALRAEALQKHSVEHWAAMVAGVVAPDSQ